MKYFFINNLKINYIPSNRSIIEYCENLGIDIPHYCYHSNLTIAGNCRMCLVEVKNSPKPVISCAMSLLNKMEIYTDSPLVKKSREGILEFLLLNHPLDCPVCDQGGECDLQDQSFVFGVDKKRFYNFKRIVTDKNIGPIVKTVMTRCIHCTRCVRFSKEIAGVESLGVFGRGVNSEIGTYITKTFNSELSGNIIDICPVGALTSKQYPFIGRVWELKNIKSIDYADSLSNSIQIYVKSNSIVKILPGYDETTKSNNWISDKTRFSFDGMFSPERLSNINVSSGNEDKTNVLTWNKVFNDIIYILYFQDHLSKHFLKNYRLVIIFNDNIDLETLNLLLLLSKKYIFISLRKSENSNLKIDLESNFLLNTFKNSMDLNKSDFCLLMNVNPRYENPSLNIKLRQCFLKGNLPIFSINSLVDLTYPVKSLGSNIKILSKITEGNHLICQNMSLSKNPFLLVSSEIFKRKDSVNIVKLLESLSNNTKLIKSNWNGYNILNTSLNESGINYTNIFKTFSYLDFSNSSSLFFIGTDFNSNNLNKIIELKLLNFFTVENPNKVILELNSLFTGSFLSKTKQNFNSAVYFNLPSKVFFENSGLYLNNIGVYKKTIKVVNTTNKSKENWQVIRKIISSLTNLNLMTIDNSNVIFNIKNIKNFINYIGFHYYPRISLSDSSKFYNKSALINLSITNKKTKIKIFNTKTKFWLEDFYLGGNDIYSRFSMVMIECSKSFRIESTNFKYIN
jgi:NADH-quinone oxidoreductase chain G